VHLGPAPEGGYFLRVVTEDAAGTKRALNHFNKHGKGELVRRLANSGRDVTSLADLLEWANSMGIRIAGGAHGEVELVV